MNCRLLVSEFDFVSPCTPAKCEILVASRFKVRRSWQLQLNPIWQERYLVVEFESPEGESWFLSAVHLTKPWFSGVSESEIARLAAQYNWFEGPVVAVGDYNMAPWSLPMRNLLRNTGFRAIRGQPASWPVSLGPAGIPIDQVLVRGGTGVTGIRPFGEGLQSNHTGFVAGIALRGPAD